MTLFYIILGIIVLIVIFAVHASRQDVVAEVEDMPRDLPVAPVAKTKKTARKTTKKTK